MEEAVRGNQDDSARNSVSIHKLANQKRDKTKIYILEAYDSFEAIKKNWLDVVVKDSDPTLKPRVDIPNLAKDAKVALNLGIKAKEIYPNTPLPKVNVHFMNHLLRIHEKFCDQCFESDYEPTAKLPCVMFGSPNTSPVMNSDRLQNTTNNIIPINKTCSDITENIRASLKRKVSQDTELQKTDGFPIIRNSTSTSVATIKTRTNGPAGTEHATELEETNCVRIVRRNSTASSSITTPKKCTNNLGKPKHTKVNTDLPEINPVSTKIIFAASTPIFTSLAKKKNTDVRMKSKFSKGTLKQTIVPIKQAKIN